MSKGDLALVISLAWPVLIFIGRNWLKAWISRSIQHRFDKELEKVRAELRKAEEQFKSDLRDREAEIATLRNSVLAGSAGRQALLDKRRFDAVEKVWTAVNDFAPFKSLAASLVVLDHKAVA